MLCGSSEMCYRENPHAPNMRFNVKYLARISAYRVWSSTLSYPIIAQPSHLELTKPRVGVVDSSVQCSAVCKIFVAHVCTSQQFAKESTEIGWSVFWYLSYPHCSMCAGYTTNILQLLPYSPVRVETRKRPIILTCGVILSRLQDGLKKRWRNKVARISLLWLGADDVWRAIVEAKQLTSWSSKSSCLVQRPRRWHWAIIPLYRYMASMKNNLCANQHYDE